MIAGGGTGGHLYPGVAVARELLTREPDATISFAGTAHGIEARVVPHEGFALDLIRSRGLKGKSAVERLRGAALLPLGLVDAWRIVTRRRPHVVLGVGGYSSGPVVLVAAMRGVPTMLLEQNAVPGLTNRLLARYVLAAAVTFESTRQFFGAKAFVSGNPVRPEFVEPSLSRGASNGEAGTTRVLVFGGSQGAHAINVAMVEAAAFLAAGGSPLRLTHQTGQRDLEMVRAGYERAALAAQVEPFLYDMGRHLGQADVIVCRAGATTLAEITAAGKAAISDSVANGDRRPPAEECRGARDERRGRAPAATRSHRSLARGPDSGAGRRTRRGAMRSRPPRAASRDRKRHGSSSTK